MHLTVLRLFKNEEKLHKEICPKTVIVLKIDV